MTKFNILLPLYNDWRSVNLLIKKINKEFFRYKRFANILILDDSSTQKAFLNINNLKNISSIRILTVNKNLGSQKIISVGLDFIKKKKNEMIIVMDSDGEDDVLQINKLINKAIKNPNFLIVASRVRRREMFIFQLLYKAHLMLTYCFTFNWVSFGNYSCFHSKNIKKILKNNDSWLAYSSCVLKNCKVIKIDTERQKRFFGKSKLSFFSLFEHSFRVLSVYQTKILLTSSLYIFFLYVITKLEIINFYNFIIFFLILLFNSVIFLTKRNILNNFILQKSELIKKIKRIK